MRLLLLGGHPSDEDILVGKPWSGEDGAFLRRVVHKALGFPEDEVIYRTLEPQGVEALLRYLADSGVEVVVPFGKEAQRALDVKGQTLRIAGIPRDWGVPGSTKMLKVVPLAHPKYVLRNPAYGTEWQSGWDVVRHLLQRGDSDWFEALGSVTFGEFPTP